MRGVRTSRLRLRQWCNTKRHKNHKNDMNEQQAKDYIDRFWDAEVIPTISRYIEIPNESPEFDPKWLESGHMQKAVALVKQWVERQDIRKSKLEVYSTPVRTPLLLLEVEGTASGDPIL